MNGKEKRGDTAGLGRRRRLGKGREKTCRRPGRRPGEATRSEVRVLYSLTGRRAFYVAPGRAAVALIGAWGGEKLWQSVGHGGRALGRAEDVGRAQWKPWASKVSLGTSAAVTTMAGDSLAAAGHAATATTLAVTRSEGGEHKRRGRWWGKRGDVLLQRVQRRVEVWNPKADEMR